MPPTLPSLRLRLGLLLAVSSLSCCSGDRAEDAAAQAFAEFQSALFRGDAAALRKLLCYESRAVIRDLVAVDLRGKKPLVVTGISRHISQYRVHVADPNSGGRESFYVLTKEDGRIRVDLLATTLYNRKTVRRRLDRPVFVPQRLTPVDIDRIKRLADRRR